MTEPNTATLRTAGSATLCVEAIPQTPTTDLVRVVIGNAHGTPLVVLAMEEWEKDLPMEHALTRLQEILEEAKAALV